MAKIRLLKAVPPDGKTRNNFFWPHSGPVECPDWNPKEECGGGLHAWLWHKTPRNDCYEIKPETTFRVIEVDDDPINFVNLGSKVKFRSGMIIGTASSIEEAISEFSLQPDPERSGFNGTATAGEYGTATAGYDGTATAGERGTATALHRGKATAGYRGTATAGKYGTATAGKYGTATAGYRGTATVGYRGTATVGYRGTATAGEYGTATAGDYGIATSGTHGLAVSGDYGTATAGYDGTATAGYGGTAEAGYGGTVAAGERGLIILQNAVGIKFAKRVGGPIRPNVHYKLVDDKFKKVEASDPEVCTPNKAQS